MKRSPLQRRTPLKAKAPLRRTPMKTAAKPTGPARDVVDAVLERSGFACERDGAGLGDRRGIDYHIHHRRPRAAGGSSRPDTNKPPNLLALCPRCHRDVESSREQALLDGFLLVQADDPLVVPVKIRGQRRVWLTPDGRYSPTPPKRDDAS